MKAAPLLALFAASACVPGVPAGVSRLAEPAPPIATLSAPPDNPDPSCWAREGTPPTVETVEEVVVMEPAGLAADGTLRDAPLTRVERREDIVRPGTEIWFETLCEADLTADRIASLQRALTVRGLYWGPITGALDETTGAAIRAFQVPLGLDSATLSRTAAERMGLVAIELPG